MSRTERGVGVLCEVESGTSVGGVMSGGLSEGVVIDGGSKIAFPMLDCPASAVTVAGVFAVDVD